MAHEVAGSCLGCRVGRRSTIHVAEQVDWCRWLRPEQHGGEGHADAAAVRCARRCQAAVALPMTLEGIVAASASGKHKKKKRREDEAHRDS